MPTFASFSFKKITAVAVACAYFIFWIKGISGDERENNRHSSFTSTSLCQARRQVHSSFIKRALKHKPQNEYLQQYENQMKKIATNAGSINETKILRHLKDLSFSESFCLPYHFIDGVGAMISRVFLGYYFANILGCPFLFYVPALTQGETVFYNDRFYCHLTSSEEQQYDCFLESSSIGQWFNFPNPMDTLERNNAFPQTNFLKIAARNIESTFWLKNSKLVAKSNDFLRSRYLASTSDRASCGYSPDVIDIAVHLRRGDLPDTHERYLSNQYYWDIMEYLIHEQHSIFNTTESIKFHIFSETESLYPSENREFDEFPGFKFHLNSKNCPTIFNTLPANVELDFGSNLKFILNSSPLATLHCLGSADAFVLSASNFSMIAAILLKKSALRIFPSKALAMNKQETGPAKPLMQAFSEVLVADETLNWCSDSQLFEEKCSSLSSF